MSRRWIIVLSDCLLVVGLHSSAAYQVLHSESGLQC